MINQIKRFVLALIFISISLQSMAQVPAGWHLKNRQDTGYYGINLDRAYEFLRLHKIKGRPVTVGIVDSGVDTSHQDLKQVLWTNPGEVAGNGQDDDNNGYVDDIHGWNFIGSKDGTRSLILDSYEVARVYWDGKEQFDGKSESEISKADLRAYRTWKRAEIKVFADSTDLGYVVSQMFVNMKFRSLDGMLRRCLKTDRYTFQTLKEFSPNSPSEAEGKELMMEKLYYGGADFTNRDFFIALDQTSSNSRSTVPYGKYEKPKNYRHDIVGDNPTDINDQYYGNSNLSMQAEHGTHVAGIIAAQRNNALGMDGVADQARLLIVRAVPDGDEHDKDIALAIRYAVDNGSRVINMSFGKSFSPQKQWVDDAVRYAADRDVLLIHAAGNDNEDIDQNENYPSPVFLDSSMAKIFITVGASSDGKTGGLAASFSNYGKNKVDVFAPGTDIYSTVPTLNKYKKENGTSMAAPVVTGLAALLMSYFPDLTAIQVKSIILATVSKPAERTRQPGTDNQVFFSDLCVTAGIVDAYEAVKLAEKISGGKE